MSSEATPIDPTRFAEALKDLPASSLALKVLELRNSIAHLDYSNAELKPFAEGTVATLDSSAASQPDQDCVDAIKENEAVIERMQQRIELIKSEVEDRGLSWDEFKGKTEEDKKEDPQHSQVNGETQTTTNGTNGVNGHAPTSENGQHPAWADGTFTTGTIGGLGDEELMRRLQERMPELQDDDEEEGMHL
ncbi:hypothetical protein BKA67DRAFT_661328 [Truncatella angustata]|uniref:Uncharacterized protein n=1 Tax=Truncatella angustata TaxID=152316 RepID=A0A9P8UE93_9PEZI|nr:uncharacterized protein BKA67DRAFT_661328 [Truncatella angustata]KAH6648345.1 hypothetical protein BKA67DRAFT_661328 [Truncatella angustata]KAH8204786.1 hypothetical protein TruAng_000975 [Truncatella angustata]